jgi:acyl carrier protein
MAGEIDKKKILNILLDTVVFNDTSAIQYDSSFSENGVDSLDMANILLAIEEKFKVKIPDEDIPRLTSVNAIADYLTERK